MVDIRRDVAGVSPNTYIRPGVVDNSASTIVGGLAEAGIKLDTGLAKERFYEDMENLRTEREVGAPSVIQQQEDAARGEGMFSPLDGQVREGFQRDADRDLRAYKQGRLSHDSMMLRGERRLRQAISKRPGLASEFRGIASQVLGSDVAGYGMKFLAEQDADAMTEALAGAKDAAAQKDELAKIQRQELAEAGFTTGQLQTPEQVDAFYAQHYEQMVEYKRTKAVEEIATRTASTQTAGQTIRKPDATREFVTWSATQRADAWKLTNQLSDVLSNPAGTEEDKAALIGSIRASLQNVVSEANSKAGAGDVDATIVAREIGMFETLAAQIEQVADGSLATELRDKRLKAIMSSASLGLMLSADDMPSYAAATQIFGPELVSQPGLQAPQRLAVAIGKVMQGTSNPVVTAASAGDMVSVVMLDVFNPNDPAPPERVASTAKLFSNAAISFVEVPDGRFKQGEFNGPSGFVQKLWTHRKTLLTDLSESQRGDLAGSLAQAAYNSQRVLASGLLQKMPSLEGKVDIRIDPDGTLFHPKAGTTLTGVEQSEVLRFNQAWAGARVMDTIGTLAYGGEGEEERTKAAKLIYRGGETVKAYRTRAEARAAQGSGGSSTQPRAGSQSRTGGPAVGTVKGGYRFKGGDPASPASWERVSE